MSTKLLLAEYPASDLECGHTSIWGGIVQAPEGQHAIPLECATCTSREEAMGELRAFAIYNALLPARTAEETFEKRDRAGTPKVMTAGSSSKMV